MSVIVKNPDNKIMLYCKGADQVINERLRPNIDFEMKAKTQEHLNVGFELVKTSKFNTNKVWLF